MTVNDWLSSVRNDIQEVTSENSTFTKGVQCDIDDLLVSVTITEQPHKYEAYVVAEPKENSNIDDAKRGVKTIYNVLGDAETGKVHTERNDRWAEKHFEVSEEAIRRL
jgi:hypothetical protein